jgi:putative glycosyltransferase (TIGR04372 family)
MNDTTLRNIWIQLAQFMRCRQRELRDEGLKALFKQAAHILKLILAVPAVILMRLARVAFTIRIGELPSGRIGHFAAETDLYLCEVDHGIQGNGTLDIFYLSESICNEHLAKMWGRVLRLRSPAKWVDRVNRFIPGGDPNVVRLPKPFDINGLFKQTPAHVYFTAEEEKAGESALTDLGLPEGATFVCFLARDSAYLAAQHPSTDWSYHDYRDVTVDNYVAVAEYLALRGYFAIRMGARVATPLKTHNPKIMDYATKARTGFLDLFLASRCEFFVGDTAGFWAVPAIFRRPMVIANIIPLENILAWPSISLVIFKKYWLKTERRLMTVREILASGAGNFMRAAEYERMGIEPVENTSEEIVEAASEMEKRLKGTWEADEEDDHLQRKFWSLFKSSPLYHNFTARIGSLFLRENNALLE